MINKFDDKYRWLSNFWLSPVTMEGLIYPSVENAYQAAKFIGDRSKYLHCTPGKAKRLGSKTDLGTDWEAEKIVVMRKLLEQKFAYGAFNANLLIATGNQPIIEGNSWGDTFWGVCDGVGENNLGRMLMKIRFDLQAGTATIASQNEKE